MRIVMRVRSSSKISNLLARMKLANRPWQWTLSQRIGMSPSSGWVGWFIKPQNCWLNGGSIPRRQQQPWRSNYSPTATARPQLQSFQRLVCLSSWKIYLYVLLRSPRRSVVTAINHVTGHQQGGEAKDFSAGIWWKICCLFRIYLLWLP